MQLKSRCISPSSFRQHFFLRVFVSRQVDGGKDFTMGICNFRQQKISTFCSRKTSNNGNLCSISSVCFSLVVHTFKIVILEKDHNSARPKIGICSLKTNNLRGVKHPQVFKRLLLHVPYFAKRVLSTEIFAVVR